MATYSLATIKALPQGTTPWIEYMRSLVDHVTQNQSDIAAFSVGSAPGWNAAIDTRYSHAETGASATAFTIAMPDASGNNLYNGASIVVYNINQANTGAATLNVGSLDGALTIKKRNAAGSLVDLEADDLVPNNPAILFFDYPYWILLNPSTGSGNATNTNILAKSSNYTIQTTDLDGYDELIVFVDASAASVTITLPTPANYDSKKIRIIADVDPAGYSVITNKSGATEHHTGYAQGDFLLATSDGTNDKVLDERVTVKGILYKTADQTFAQGASGNGFAASYSVGDDIGGWHDSVTNHHITVAFDVRMKCTYLTSCAGGDVLPAPYINGSYYIAKQGFDSAMSPVISLDFPASTTFRPDFKNTNTTGGNKSLYGDAANDETMFQWEVIERLR